MQVRAQGFSFNRLAPYSGLDDYLPEIERTWSLYVDLASPVQIRAIRLRYINRILLPLAANTVDLDEYLKIGPACLMKIDSRCLVSLSSKPRSKRTQGIKSIWCSPARRRPTRNCQSFSILPSRAQRLPNRPIGQAFDRPSNRCEA